MAEWTPEEIFAFYANDREVGPDRVHWQRSIPFPGRPGHFYFLSRRPRAPSHRDLARITAHSGHSEVVLMRINSTYVVSIGNRGVANATVRIPPRLDGINRFTLLAHTHPLEMENKYEGISQSRCSMTPTSSMRLPKGPVRLATAGSERFTRWSAS